MDSKIFKAYDIRGIYPEEINEEAIRDIVKAIYTFFLKDSGGESLSIVLGRDMRVSSPSLFEEAKNSLLKLGAAVIDVGLVSTPTFYFSVLDGQYDAGIQISASHNPKEYNGIKFAKRVDNQLIKIGQTTGMSEVKDIALNKKFHTSSDKGSVVEKKEVVASEVASALKVVPAVKIKKFKVVADPGNAMGALFIEELMKHIPCELVKINFELDGTFPSHQPDPLQFDTLRELQKKVIDEKADLGIAPDGDGDRVFFIDEKGEVIPSTLISSLIAKEILLGQKGEKILVDIRYTKNVKNIVEKNGGNLLISRVGHALITEQLNKEAAAFAGESSGHFYFRETGGGESSVRVILYVLEMMSREGKPISDIVTSLKSSLESGEINFVIQKDAKDMLEALSEKYKDAEVSWLDGISLDYPNWRFNVRTSNTEPLLRLNVEADDKSTLDNKVSEIVNFLEGLGASKK